MEHPRFSDYTIVIRPDCGMWFAYVPAFPDIYCQADTAEEAWHELRAVFDMVTGFCMERGIPLPADVRELVAVAS
jgi:predicted RNase H-like HicB family nuclease